MRILRLAQYTAKLSTSHGSYQSITDGVSHFETEAVSKVNTNPHNNFYTHDYSSDGEKSSTYLSESRATIKIFDRVHGLVKVIPVSLELIGDTWNIFEINNGSIVYLR